MDIKKYPKKQLHKYSKIFMQIGLALSLFIVHTLMEHKTYERVLTPSSLGEVHMIVEMQEDIPILPTIKIKATQTKADPPPTLEKVKVVEDDVYVAETILKSTETNENEAVTNAVVSKITTDDIIEAREEQDDLIEDVPFLLIEDVPVYPGCTGNNEQLKACFTEKVTRFFGNRFDEDLPKELGLTAGNKRLYVVFTIDKTGKVVNVMVRGPHPTLETEVFKIFSALPRMTPGKQRGIPVGVTYSIPITIKVFE